MRRLLFAVLILHASCKQACGLELIADTGGSGPGAAGGSGSGGSGGCTTPDSLDPTQDLCVMGGDRCQEFDTLSNNLQVDGGMLQGAPMQANGVLRITQGAGFWDGSGALAYYPHYPNLTDSFFASTIVRPRNVQANGWPGEPYNLGGLVVRDGACANSVCGLWLKSEAGTLGDGQRGMRVAHHDNIMAMLAPEIVVDDVQPAWLNHCGQVPWVQIAICAIRNDQNQYRITTQYRELGDSWISINDEFVIPATSLDVGIVGAGIDISAEFAYIEVIPVENANHCDQFRLQALEAVEPP